MKASLDSVKKLSIELKEKNIELNDLNLNLEKKVLDRTEELEAVNKKMQKINQIIAHNIRQFNNDKYMTITVFAFDNEKFTFSGLHQDILIYRTANKEVERIETNGMWLGIIRDIANMVSNDQFIINSGDIILLYTDGITEATLKESTEIQSNSEMFGEQKLINIFRECGNTNPQTIRDNIVEQLKNYDRDDDVTMLIIKRL